MNAISPDENGRPNGRFAILIPAALFMLFSLTGCGMGYYTHLAFGQLKLILGSVPVEEAVKEGSLSQEEKERLLLVARIKEFGEKQLGLKSTGSYETVYLKSRRNPLYTISASPKDRLSRVTWHFPIVGDMPYLGFFDRESAERKKTELLKQDLDVIVSKADAYSTLGWFKDPVTLNLLEEDSVELAETILHEMTHTTIYLKGQGDFNEGFAMLVGMVGAARFFEQSCGPTHPYTVAGLQAIEDERSFSILLDFVMKRLEGLYDSSLSYQEKLSRRETTFSRAVEEFKGLRRSVHTERYSRFGPSGVNNAYLMSLALYHRRFPLFEAFLLSREGSMKKTLTALQSMAAAEGKMLDKMQSTLDACALFR